MSEHSCINQIEDVYSKISEVAMDGGMSVILPGIKEGTISALIREEYTIKSLSILNGKIENEVISTEISW